MVLSKPLSTTQWGEFPYDLIASDLDGDGFDDLVAVNNDDSDPSEAQEQYVVSVLLNESSISTPTTTTTTASSCSSELIYGDNSEETKLLREFRDNVLSTSPLGREIIKLYYEWSPAIVKAMENNKSFEKEIKEMIDGILPLIEQTTFSLTTNSH